MDEASALRMLVGVEVQGKFRVWIILFSKVGLERVWGKGEGDSHCQRSVEAEDKCLSGLTNITSRSPSP